MHPSVVYDTQIYRPVISGGRADESDSDGDWELTTGSRILSDSEPPSESSSESDEESDGGPMIVSKTAMKSKVKKMTNRAIIGGSGSNWGGITSDFISYLAKAKLPI